MMRKRNERQSPEQKNSMAHGNSKLPPEEQKLQIHNSTVDFLVYTMAAPENGIEVRAQDRVVWLIQKRLHSFLLWCKV